MNLSPKRVLGTLFSLAFTAFLLTGLLVVVLLVQRSQEIQKGKAVGEAVQLSLNPSTAGPINVNDTFTVSVLGTPINGAKVTAVTGILNYSSNLTLVSVVPGSGSTGFFSYPAGTEALNLGTTCSAVADCRTTASGVACTGNRCVNSSYPSATTGKIRFDIGAACDITHMGCYNGTCSVLKNTTPNQADTCSTTCTGTEGTPAVCYPTTNANGGVVAMATFKATAGGTASVTFDTTASTGTQASGIDSTGAVINTDIKQITGNPVSITVSGGVTPTPTMVTPTPTIVTPTPTMITPTPTNTPTPPAGTFTLGDTGTPGTFYTGRANLLTATPVTLAQTATIQSISIFITTGTTTERVMLGIYSDNSGSPGSLLARTAESSGFYSNGFNTLSIVSPVTLTPGNYWLAYLANSNTMGFGLNNSGSSKYATAAYGTLPTSFPSPTTSLSSHAGIYATLTTTTVTPTPVSPTPPPVTPTPPPTTGTLNVVFKFFGMNGDISTGTVVFPQKQVRVRLYTQTTTPSKVAEYSVTAVPNALGVYTATVNGVVTGTYDVYLKGWAHLQKNLGTITIIAGQTATKDVKTTASMYQLPGDLAGSIITANLPDNMIDSSDLGYLINEFAIGVKKTSPADFTGDGYVDSDDLALIVNNFRMGVYGDGGAE